VKALCVRPLGRLDVAEDARLARLPDDVVARDLARETCRDDLGESHAEVFRELADGRLGDDGGCRGGRHRCGARGRDDGGCRGGDGRGDRLAATRADVPLDAVADEHGAGLLGVDDGRGCGFR
jgi:hypothetical protein